MQLFALFNVLDISLAEKKIGISSLWIKLPGCFHYKPGPDWGVWADRGPAEGSSSVFADEVKRDNEKKMAQKPMKKRKKETGWRVQNRAEAEALLFWMLEDFKNQKSCYYVWKWF